MKDLIKVELLVTDKGVEFTRTEEVILTGTLIYSVQKALNKYRTAMGLSRNFKFKILSHQHIGWC